MHLPLTTMNDLHALEARGVSAKIVATDGRGGVTLKFSHEELSTLAHGRRGNSWDEPDRGGNIVPEKAAPTPVALTKDAAA